jgi:hypothetical protein
VGAHGLRREAVAGGEGTVSLPPSRDRRRLEFTLRHAGRLNHRQVRIWVHGDYVGKTRARNGRIHLQLDTANGDLVPHVKQFDRVFVRLRYKTYRSEPDLHKLIATGEYICEHRHCRP